MAAARAAAFLRASEVPAHAEWAEKDRNDFVTAVDRQAERLIIEALTGAVPGSTVLGEELSPAAPHTRGVVWIVDPLDGTTNFLHGYQHYAVSIGCAVDGELCVGVVHDVTRDLVYQASAGHGAWMSGERIRVSPVTDQRRALIGTGFPYKRFEGLEDYLAQLASVLRESGGVRRAGTASLDLAAVASGRFEAFWELLLAPWDKAAGTVLVREAGGVVTTLDGDADIVRHGSIVAGSPHMHQWLRSLLGGR